MILNFNGVLFVFLNIEQYLCKMSDLLKKNCFNPYIFIPICLYRKVKVNLVVFIIRISVIFHTHHAILIRYIT